MITTGWADARLLARHLRLTGSFTATLAAQLGVARIDVKLVRSSLILGAALDTEIGDQLQVLDSAEVQIREVVMRAGDVDVASATSYVAIGGLSHNARSALTRGVSLGEALAPDGRRRVPVLVAHAKGPTGKPGATAIRSIARLDSPGGTPLALCVEHVLEAAMTRAGAVLAPRPRTMAGA